MVEIIWKEGKLIEAKILSKLGEKTKVKYRDKTIGLFSEKGQDYQFDQNLNFRGLGIKGG